MSNVAILISTCDKFSDLWDEHIALLKKNWKGEMWDVFLVTDKQTSRSYEGVKIISAGEDKDFPMRIKFAVAQIDSAYILLTLDDYFVIDEVHSNRLQELVERSIKDNISYLKLYDRRKTNPKKYEPLQNLVSIDLNKKYAITLYPAIWERNFLYESVQKDMTPWLYEPSLTKYARDKHAICMFSHSGVFNILDVVRKGKVLHKADRYFKKNEIDIGNRPIIGWKTEVKLAVMDWISWYTPRKLFVFGKNILRKMGKNFYSED